MSGSAGTFTGIDEFKETWQGSGGVGGGVLTRLPQKVRAASPAAQSRLGRGDRGSRHLHLVTQVLDGEIALASRGEQAQEVDTDRVSDVLETVGQRLGSLTVERGAAGRGCTPPDAVPMDMPRTDVSMAG